MYSAGNEAAEEEEEEETLVHLCDSITSARAAEVSSNIVLVVQSLQKSSADTLGCE